MTSTTTPIPSAVDGSAPAAEHDPVLDRLLDAELSFDPIARRGFINHTAMALVAARRLGAGDEDLERWFRDDASGDFLVPRARPDWLAPETDDVRRRGARVVTAERLPALVAAPGSQFFHAVIRLELALDADHPGQVANALHNWADHDTPLGPAPAPAGERRFAEVLDVLRAQRLAGRLPEAAAGVLATHDVFRSTFDTLAEGPDLLDDVAATVAAIHTSADDFGTLHLVTGTRAARAVADLVDDPTRRELARRTAQAVALLWATFGAPAPAGQAVLDRRREQAPSSWATTCRRAIDTGDHHVVKLVYAARLEQELTGDPLYSWLAARQAGAA
jgi:hypothetical protein